MCTANKVLLGLIVFASLFFLFFAARALKTHQCWRQRVAASEKKWASEEKMRLELLGETDASERVGLRQAKFRLHNLLANRGRVWSHAVPGAFQAETGNVTVTTEKPNPQGMVGTVLFAFSETPVKDGGRYLGQFTVTSQAEKQLQLQPSEMMTHAEVQRLQKSTNGPWILYDILPSDDHETFAGLDEATKRAMLPASSVEEYLTDGQTQPDGSKVERKLRDYGVLFAGYHRQRAMLFEQLAAAKHDKHYLLNAVAGAHKQEQFHNTEINTLKANLAEEQRRLAAVQTHLQAVETTLADTQTQIHELTAANRTLVSKIARIQLEATRQIDERTQGVVQASH